MLNDAQGVVHHKLGQEEDAEDKFQDAIRDSIELNEVICRPEYH